MKLAFDTSAVVAALLEQHPHHPRMLPWLDAISAKKVEASISWHAAAETWSVLSRLPGSLRLAPATATLVVERALTVFRPIEVLGGDYRTAFGRSSERGARSGALFDALHLVVAERQRVAAFVTFNAGDFNRLTTGASPRILTPPDPPTFST
jgi:predicted nucleic acid-binding protein